MMAIKRGFDRFILSVVVRLVSLSGVTAGVPPCKSTRMKPTLYGIRNCDNVKKARAWLDAAHVSYDFHDYKTAGIDEARLRGWARELGWERLLNRGGTTFRQLPDADKQDLNEDKAIALMLASPSMIRRPVVDLGDLRLVGFSDDLYRDAFKR